MSFAVNLAPEEAERVILEGVERSGLSAECVGAYHSAALDGKRATMLVFEKYYMRNSSRASLSVIIENLSGQTVVEAIGSGGGQSVLWGNDWGAADNFVRSVETALRPYRV